MNINVIKNKIFILSFLLFTLLSFTCGYFEGIYKQEIKFTLDNYNNQDICFIDKIKIQNIIKTIKKIKGPYKDKLKVLIPDYNCKELSSTDQIKMQNLTKVIKKYDFAKHLFFGMVLFQMIFMILLFLINFILNGNNNLNISIDQNNYYIKSIVLSFSISLISIFFVPIELEVVANNGTYSNQFVDIIFDQIGMFFMFLIYGYSYKKTILKIKDK